MHALQLKWWTQLLSSAATSAAFAQASATSGLVTAALAINAAALNALERGVALSAAPKQAAARTAAATIVLGLSECAAGRAQLSDAACDEDAARDENSGGQLRGGSGAGRDPLACVCGLLAEPDGTGLRLGSCTGLLRCAQPQHAEGSCLGQPGAVFFMSCTCAYIR